MLSLILKTLEKYSPPYISIPLCLIAGFIYLGNIAQTGIDMVIHEARQPFYLSTEYALAKQEEKLSKDPGDLKTTDIELLSIMCADDFGKSYIPSLPANRRLDAEGTCNKLTELYTSRMH